MSLYWLYMNDPTQQSLQSLSTSLVGQPLVNNNNNKLVYAVTNNKFTLPPNEMKVAWSYLPGLQTERPDTSKHFHIFVGDLCPKLHPSQLYETFSPFGQISECKIIQDPQTMNSKGYGFVTFVRKEDAETAINSMNGHLLGSRTIRTNWAVRKKSLLPQIEGGSSKTYEDVYSQTNASNCTVYCGGIMTGLTEELMMKTFSTFGNILDIRLFRDKGYAFIRFDSKESATRAIVERHLTEINGHAVKCSWGKKSEEGQGVSSSSPSITQILAPTILPTVGLTLAQPTSHTSYTNWALPSSDTSNQLRYFVWPENSVKIPEATAYSPQGYSLPFQMPALATLPQAINTFPQQQQGYVYTLGL